MQARRLTKGMARHVLGATALAMLLGGAALAQERRTYEIGAQPLRSALSQLAQQAGLNVAVPASQTAGLTSAAVTGAQSPEQALAALLRGTGLSLVIVDGTVVAAAPAAQSGAVEDGTVLLSPVALSAGGAYWDGNPAAVYDTTANVEAIHSGTLETYQIATPSDILRSATGVMSGDSRNSGSLNVNIHGLQGQGRVPVTVDGAENNTTVYRGYQGVADRSFIDPDFIGSVGIEKGASTARAGIGGAVSITTLTVDDILREGQSSGFRLKVSAAGNTSRSPFGTTPGNSASRPGLLSPTSGSTSLSYAHRGEWVDLVAGLSYRRSGNYHAGSHGDTVGEYYNQYNQLVYGDLSPVGHDGEALNTSNETLSGLLKATFNFSDDLKWRLGYSRYDTKFGEVMPSRYFLYGLTEAKPTETTLDSLTSRLRWNPAGSDLVDLTWNVWLTRLETENAAISTTETVLTKSKVLTFGTDLTNKAHFSTSWGEVSWTSGIAYKHEDAKVATAEPGSATGLMNREGARHEASVFSNAEWTPNSWLSFNAGLRYSYADISPRSTAFATDSHASSFDKSFGVAVKPNDDITLYANYRFASRLPSLYESVLQTVIAGNSSIQPERVHNLDIGVNMTRDNIIGDDSLRFKFSYFDSKIDNYVIRNMGNNGTALGIFFLNIDKARFQGFDLSSEYERLGFSARLSATYYTGVEFCNSTGCAENSYAGDYSKNHMPPKFQLALDMSQTFMDDRLTLGGRVTRTGSRVNSPAQMLAGNSLIAPIVWKPHTVVDLYAHYKINEDLRVSFDIHNLADAYYVQPLSLASTPGPGRTARISLDYRF